MKQLDSKRNIGIFVGKVDSVGQWDVNSTASGITGSEEAVAYISVELAKLGYHVIVFGNPLTTLLMHLRRLILDL